MATRSSHRWANKPGSFDALHATRLFPSSNEYGIPDMRHTPTGRLPAWLVAYRERIRGTRPPGEGAVHFFLDDYRFETVWSRPFKALAALAPYPVLLSPDFSLYRDWPLMLQMWNVYRNRWCGRFWQEQGFTVIPSVGWSTAASYDFCFLGVPRRGPVAVSAVGVRLDDPLEGELFLAGFRAMARRLEPGVVLSYGPLPPACHELADVIPYPTRWQVIRSGSGRKPMRNDIQDGDDIQDDDAS